MMNGKQSNARGGEYTPPVVEILLIAAERGFAATGNNESKVPGFDDPDVLSWEYGDTNQ